MAVLLALLALAAQVPADPVLVGNPDGSVTLTAPIRSSPPPLLDRAARPSRNAGHVRARREAEAELDRSFREATAQARDAARLPPPH
ncbi:MAG TPA: hypothetical protein VFW19_15550 [Allosphingosinicella sp.]|nr:hypothetical protein [Allosphingosinicella sp.]